MRLCCRYLLKEKKRSLGLDKVLNFHIRNGACFDRLNWMGDVSSRGLKQSFGIMVNYHYVLSQIEANNQQYLLDGTISITSAATDSNQVDPYVMRAFSLSGKQEDEGGLYTISSSSVGGPAIKLRRVNVSLEQHTSKL